MMVGLSLYAVAHLWQLVSTDPIIKHTKKCKYCRQRINEKVRRCHSCVLESLQCGVLMQPCSQLDASTVPVGSMGGRSVSATRLTYRIHLPY